MKVYKDIYSANIKNPFVTVGIFDGVHLGHQSIFKQLKKLAQSNDGQSVVVTFWPHPKMVIESTDEELLMITSIEEKIQLIEEQGIEHLIILPFTKEFSQLSSDAFIEHYLFKILHIKGLVVGFDHKFGKDREGNFNVLQNYAQKYNFIIQEVEALIVNELKISSTGIRNALLKGEIELANFYLSRSFTISGTVINGKKIGRDLGFPTANIKPEFPYKLIPCDGVYAVHVTIQDIDYQGMLNIGNRPTFNNGNETKSIEVHILGFNGILYGKKIRLSFYRRIRNEMKFNSVEELISQLFIDKQQVESFFS